MALLHKESPAYAKPGFIQAGLFCHVPALAVVAARVIRLSAPDNSGDMRERVSPAEKRPHLPALACDLADAGVFCALNACFLRKKNIGAIQAKQLKKFAGALSLALFYLAFGGGGGGPAAVREPSMTMNPVSAGAMALVTKVDASQKPRLSAADIAHGIFHMALGHLTERFRSIYAVLSAYYARDVQADPTRRVAAVRDMSGIGR